MVTQAVCVYLGRDKPAATLAPGPSARTWRPGGAWLFSREREFPNDAPTWDEMALWFAACVLCLGGATLGAGGVRLIAKRGAAPAFFGLALVLGFLGPNLFSAAADQLLFTWPASLYVAFHVAVMACWSAQQRPTERRLRWLARLSIVSFLVVGYAYFELCKAAGMFIGWAFLVGFPFAFPAAFLAVWTQRPWISRRLDTAGVYRVLLELPGLLLVAGDGILTITKFEFRRFLRPL